MGFFSQMYQNTSYRAKKKEETLIVLGKFPSWRVFWGDLWNGLKDTTIMVTGLKYNMGTNTKQREREEKQNSFYLFLFYFFLEMSFLKNK